MRQTIVLPIGQGFYQSESIPLSDQECTNLFPSSVQTSTISEMAVFGIPGLTAPISLPGTNRGIYSFNNIPYYVNDNTLWRIDITFDDLGVMVLTEVDSGEIPGVERVVMSDNGRQLAILVPELDIVFNLFILEDTTLTQVSDTGFSGPASDIIFNQGFFLLTKKDGSKFFKSGLRDGLSYLATDFADAEQDPDLNVGLVNYRNEVFILGSTTMEGVQNIGGTGFPYVFSGISERKGLISTQTLIETEGFLFWLGSADKERAQILMYDGSRPRRISTRAIEVLLNNSTKAELASAFAWQYEENANVFIGFTLSNTTIVYDLSTQLWHERKSANALGQPVAYSVSGIVEAEGVFFVGDIYTGNVGVMSRDVFTEYGESIRRRLVLPPFDNKGMRTFVQQVELVAETGIGTVKPQPGWESEVFLSWSDDGGRNYEGHVEASLGLIGEYEHRVIWYGLGSFQRERMWAIETSAQLKIAFYKLEVTIDI